MVDQVVPGHPAHGKRHFSLCEGDHRNDNFTFFFICKYLVWGIILQAYSLWNVVPSLKAFHIGRRIYEVLEHTHLGKLKGCERNFQRKKTKNRRPRIWAEEKKA